MGENVFCDSSYFIGDETDEYIHNFVVYGVEGSKAEKYSKEYGFNFIAIDEETPSIMDILNLKKYILSITTNNTNLDFNSDEKVNILDLNIVLNQLIK